MIDGHIHIISSDINKKEFVNRLNMAGFTGGVILSMPPKCNCHSKDITSAKDRLEQLFNLTSENKNMYPVFWIDPLEDDAIMQVETAVNMGVKAFKIICDRYYPSDPCAMTVFKKIASFNKPIIFHSGILWNGKDSGKYSRPVNFEALLEIDNLRFSLAHGSWPWIDECIAVYGKFLNTYAVNPNYKGEMFIDITPGTPVIYRKELLYKLFNVGYDIENNVIFGTDSVVHDYNVDWAIEWINRDSDIYKELGVDVKEKVFSKNIKRFLGLVKDDSKPSSIKMGE